MPRLDFEVWAHDHASEAFKRIGEEAEGTHARLTKLGRVGAAAFLGVAAGAVIFGAKSVEAFTKHQQAMAQLENAYRKFPALANVNIDAFKELNDELEKKTQFDRDAYAQGEATLAQFGLTGAQVKRMIPLVADFAAKTGRSVPDAAIMLGKGLMGNTRALKEVGINFHATGNRAKDYATIAGLLQKRVGGTAEVMGKTAAGQSAILAHSWEELESNVGSHLVPQLTKLTGVGIKVVGWLESNWTWVGKVIGVVGVLGGVVWGITKAVKVWTAVQTALDVVLNANPIGLVIVAVAGLAAGIIYAYKHSQRFRDIVHGAFTVIGTAGKWLWNSALKPAFTAIGHALTAVGQAATWLWRRVLFPTFNFITRAWLAVAGAIIHGAAAAFGWVPGIGPKLRGAARQFDVFRNNVNAALNGLRDKSITVSATLGLSTTPTLNAIQGNNKRNAMRGYLSGGPVQGGVPGRDSVPALLAPNEFVVRSDGSNLHEAMQHFGARGFMRGGVVLHPRTPGEASMSGRVSRAFDGLVAHSHTAIVNALLGSLSGGSVGGSGVTRWAPLILRVLSMLGQSAGWLPLVERRMNQESGGNPLAINRWDSNAAAGHPSMGLMQTIAGTFAAYAGPFRGLGILNPMANIYAGLNYALHRYGSLAALGRPGGYDRGGLLMPGLHMVYNGTGKPETVVPPGAGRFGGPMVIQVLLDGRILAEWIEANGATVQKGLLKVKRHNGNAALGLA